MVPDWPDTLVTDYVRIQDVLRSIAEAFTPTSWVDVDAPTGLTGTIRYRRNINTTVLQFQVDVVNAASFSDSSMFTLPEALRPIGEPVILNVPTGDMGTATLTIQTTGVAALSVTAGAANRSADFGHVIFMSVA